MSLQHDEPWSILNQIQRNFHRILPEMWSNPRSTTESSAEASQWVPVDIHEGPDSFLALVDLPGIDPEHIDITMENQVLTVKGERTAEKQVQQGDYIRRERYTGRFCRQFILSTSADGERITAQYRNGVLEVTIPKKEQSKSRKITIRPSS